MGPLASDRAATSDSIRQGLGLSRSLGNADAGGGGLASRGKTGLGRTSPQLPRLDRRGRQEPNGGFKPSASMPELNVLVGSPAPPTPASPPAPRTAPALASYAAAGRGTGLPKRG